MNVNISALCNIYLMITKIDLKSKECITIKDGADDGFAIGGVTNAREFVDVLVANLASPDDAKRLREYVDFETVLQRIGGQTHLFGDYRFKRPGWCRIGLVPDRAQTDDASDCLLVVVYDIDEEKQTSIKKQKEIERNNIALHEALTAATYASQAKTTFLNSMSHDIRTPMNAIIGFTSLAAAHIDSRDAVEEYLKKITVSSNHLLSLINDVLDMSRIESGRTKLEEAEVSLPEVLHDLRSIIQSNIQAKQLDFYIDIQDVVNENVMVDKLRLNQVLLNILGNAIKFTPMGGTITMRVIENTCSRPDYAEYEFHIKDTGIGMSMEYQKHIFEPFSREETVTVNGIQGSGLGMAITKNIVDMMNGAIAVNSEMGKGTEFTVILDLKKTGKPVSQDEIPELKDMHALVADDDFNTCSSVSKMLTTISMRPEWTTSGKEAVLRARYARQEGDEFRAFIIDWLMPDMNGIEVVRRIRKEVGDDTPIIILTAYDWTAIEDEAREAGVTGFCSKPLFLSELRDVLSRPFRKVDEPKEKQEIDPSGFAGRRILLAEDNQLNQELAEAILTEYGFEVDIASDGMQALDKMNAHQAGYYDVLITDIQMPVMNGYNLSRNVRSLEDKGKANIPILALTANAFEEDRQLAQAAQMDGHLSKPIDVQEMLNEIKRVMR